MRASASTAPAVRLPANEDAPGLALSIDSGPRVGPTARDRLLVALRDQGMTYRQIADTLGLDSVNGIRVSVSVARKRLKALKLTFDLACERVDQEIVPIAVDRLHGLVSAGNPEAVFRTLEGRNVLRPKGTTDQAAAQQNTTLNVTFQQVGTPSTIAVGSIVGSPRSARALPDRQGPPILEGQALPAEPFPVATAPTTPLPRPETTADFQGQAAAMLRGDR